MTSLTKSAYGTSVDLTICRSDEELNTALESLPCHDIPQITEGTCEPSLVSNSNERNKRKGRTVWDLVLESRERTNRNAKAVVPDKEQLVTSVMEYDGKFRQTARRWRALTDQEKLWYYAFALREFGAPKLFSILPTDDIQHRMRKSRFGPREYMKRRMEHQFADIPFYFALELTTAAGKAHIHGALAQTAQTDADIAKRLHAVSGDVRKQIGKDRKYFYNRHACHMQQPNPNKQCNHMKGDLGWAEYCGKHLQKTAALLQQTDKIVARTQLVNQCAELIFNVFIELKMSEASRSNSEVKIKDHL
ncbi:hypothetical protein [Terasakiella pusilla]|uniref:hypothetical protein n=1 Tax=Terasakiella pusilla TaxID=64973 RepID=UPI003AA8E42A